MFVAQCQKIQEDSPFILNIGCFFPKRLNQLSHVLGMLLMDPRQLVVEVADCKVKLFRLPSFNCQLT